MRVFLFVVLFSMICLSCERLFLRKGTNHSPSFLFEELWMDIHNRYAYFEEKNIDWDAVRLQYAPQISEDLSEKELFEILADMLFELEDGHVNLTSTFNRSRNWDWFQDFPLNYNQNLIDQQYLGKDFWITGPLHHAIIDSVLYVNYRSFMDEIKPEHMDVIVNRAKGLHGVIIDVRSNGGGSLANALMLASAFTDESITYGQTRIKTGSCSDCFSAWNEQRISPRSGEKYLGNVVVLTNRRSYSSTTYFAQMMRALSNATLIGDITGGGGGTPAYGELSNGWLYRFSSTQFIDENGYHLEFGVPVDHLVEMNSQDEIIGLDSILEFAIALLK
jgi:hypothetical protein